LKTLEISPEAFYALRKVDAQALPPVARAGRTLYLNKTCFNGLYRLNKRGGFNVPWGAYKAPRVLDTDNLRACATQLASVTFLEGDFVEAVRDAGPGDVVYFDPPYVPLTPTSSFRSYTKEGFTLKDQQRLGVCFEDLVDRGVSALVSNSDTPDVHEIYKRFDMRLVSMRRNINSKGNSRGPVNEVIVTSKRATTGPDAR
jgi:DNA adenine methylase